MTRKRENILLAHPAEQKRILSLGDTFYVQPKYNGVRCYTEPDSVNNTNYLYSSTGLRKVCLPTIEREIAQLPFKSFDGELYKHGKPWNWINSIASRTVGIHKEESELEYHIFDLRSDFSQNKRIAWIESLQDTIEKLNLTHIKVTQTWTTDQSNWPAWLEDFTQEQDYEGIIFRHKFGTYEKKRSKYLLKLKPTETDIYKIVSLIQGKGWCYDRLGAFLVEDKHGNQFEVGSGANLTKDLRLYYWEHENEIVGKYLLVKHEKLKTKNGFPQCAVSVNVLSDYEVKQYIVQNHNDLINT